MNVRRKLMISVLVLFAALGLASAQEDTTIYTAVPDMPRFPVCEELDTTLAVKRQCADEALLSFMYSNIQYPQEAIQENISGTVVLSFVVEKDGLLSQIEVVRDIGGGCGEEAVRVLSALNEYDVHWVPGILRGDTVRVRMSLPVRFRIKEPLPYTLVEGDTVYTQFERGPVFKPGTEQLDSMLQANLVYPASGLENCQIGAIDAEILVQTDGSVKVLQLIDYNALGSDFWYAAIQTVNATIGLWEPARYEGREVSTSLTIQLPFQPASGGCATKLDLYQSAHQLAGEAATLLEKEKFEEAIGKLDLAVALFPQDAYILLQRGEAHLAAENYPQACADLGRAQEIALVNWYDSILPLICAK